MNQTVSVDEAFRAGMLDTLHDYLSDLTEEITDIARAPASSERAAAELLIFVELARTWGYVAELDNTLASRRQRDFFERCLVCTAIGDA